MNDTKLIEKEFNSDLIPGIHIIVEDGTVKLHTPNMALEETNYTQKQICELISLLVEVYDYIDNTKENNTMDLFDEKEDNNIEEIVVMEDLIDPSLEPIDPNEIPYPDLRPEEETWLTEETTVAEEPCGCFNEIADNATAFLYMKEDYSLQRITKDDMHHALHILKDSIISYLNDIEEDEPEQKQLAAGE
jgi:hypothetical protein